LTETIHLSRSTISELLLLCVALRVRIDWRYLRDYSGDILCRGLSIMVSS
jgi:hypothetical protein